MTPNPKPREPHQERVLEECIALTEKYDKLRTFIYSPAFRSVPEAERRRLHRQELIMQLYLDVLGDRIGAF